MPLLDTDLAMKGHYQMPCPGPPSIMQKYEIFLDLHMDHPTFSDTRLPKYIRGLELPSIVHSLQGNAHGCPVTHRQTSRVAHKNWEYA